MTQSGPVEEQVQAWLDTIDASGPQTIQTMPASTIVPPSRDLSTQRAAAFLAQLAERGKPVELWPANPDARSGILRATIAVAEYELACGDARAAVTLLGELDEKPALLATAQAKAEAQVQRQQELEAMGRDVNPTVAPATFKIIVPMCFLFVLLPLVPALRPGMGLDTHAATIGFAAGCFGVLAAISLLVRRTKMTAINRSVFAAGRFLFLSQTVMSIGMWQLGLSSNDTLVINLFMWGSICGMFALAIDRWLVMTAVGYYLAFLLTARYPELRMYAASGGNLVLTLAVAWRWRARR